MDLSPSTDSWSPSKVSSQGSFRPRFPSRFRAQDLSLPRTRPLPCHDLSAPILRSKSHLPVRPASWVPSGPSGLPLRSLAAFRKVCDGRGLGCLLSPSTLLVPVSRVTADIQRRHARHHSIHLDTVLTKVLGRLGYSLGASRTASCVDWHASQFSPAGRRSPIGLLFSLLCRLSPDHRPTPPTGNSSAPAPTTRDTQSVT